MRGKSGRREALPAPAMRPVAATAVARRAVRLPGMKLIMLKWTNRPLQAVVALLAAIVFVQATASAAEDCAIATAHPLATRAGCDILAKGGNAFDAAIAVTAALAVVEPFASGIGGGGFYLLHRAADGVQTFVDARETAPAGATAAFYLDEQGQPKDRLSLDGPAAAGIPGIPAAIDWIAQRYALLPLQDTIAPAIALARDGFTADSRYVWATGYRASVLNRFANGGSAFLDGGKGVDQGFVVRQPDLARTLSKLAEQGRDGFYRGDVARALVDAVRADGGLWTLDDLAEYAVVERQPYRFGFRGARITTAPLPSSGGLVLAQALQILDQFPIDSVDEAERAHLIVEAMRRGYNDRARYMGDPDFVDVPVAMLGSRDYARRRAAGIDAARATPSSELPSVAEAGGESQQTTHFSIVDRFGNRVAATLSVNGPFGSGFVAGDTGVLLNNHMNDFSLAIAAPNLYKLVGNDANAIAPGKRPRCRRPSSRTAAACWCSARRAARESSAWYCSPRSITCSIRCPTSSAWSRVPAIIISTCPTASRSNRAVFRKNGWPHCVPRATPSSPAGASGATCRWCLSMRATANAARPAIPGRRPACCSRTPLRGATI
jgi:gamma-glutamyltranspeptidase / glutathione hydrolase